MGCKLLRDLQKLFQTRHPVIVYPASGTGAWEAALVNTLSPGDHVLMYETGHFAATWTRLAQRLGLHAEVLVRGGSDAAQPEGSHWRHPVSADLIEERLRRDGQHRIKAVCVVHNETSTGCASDIAAVRRAIDAAGHPSLLLVDSVSGLGAMELRHDDWGIDVTVAGSQKGLMMPPGISFNAISARALEASKSARLPRSFFAWDDILEANQRGYWPYTPSTNLLYGLAEAMEMLLSEGREQVFARHHRWGQGVRAAIRAWGLQIQCAEEGAHSPILTGVILPSGFDADTVRQTIHQRFDLSLGAGLGKLKGRMFRIGHLGDSNDLTLLAALAGCEMGLRLAGVPLAANGVQAAMDYFSKESV